MQSENPHAIAKRCGAKTRSGVPCKARPMPNGRCRMHGGSTPSGAGLPQLRHGRYSRYLPAHLAERYQDAISDENLLALHDEIAVIDTRVMDLLTIDDEIPIENWFQVERLFDLRRRLVETERKRLVDTQQMMTSEQAMTLLATVVSVVKTHVQDRHTLAAISADLARLVNADNGGTA